ncbi:MAG: hypothetical protein ACK53Y_20775 [bacterium]
MRNFTPSTVPHVSIDSLTPSTSLPNSKNLPSSDIHIPILCTVDKPSSLLPEKMMMLEDFIHASVGFYRVDTLKQHFSDLYLNTVQFDLTPADAILNSGNLATMGKMARNTVPVP